MGVELVKEATRPEWAGVLSDAGYRVLVAMALHALDRPRGDRPAGVYHGGHGPIALAVCGAETPAAEQKVKRAVRHLLDVGAIERLRDPTWLGGPVYRLTLHTINQPALIERNTA